MITRKQLLSFWPDVLGIAALVLPFTAGVRPLVFIGYGVAYLFQDIYSLAFGIWLLSAPVVFTVYIAIWQVLRVLRGIPTKTGLILAYTLSIVVMLAPVTLSVWRLLSGGGPSEDEYALFVLAVVSVCTLIAANTLLLRHNLKAAAPTEVSAGVLLIGGYLPGATLLLITFFPSGSDSGWQIGAYFVLAACIGYVLRIISLMRHGTKVYRPQGKPGVSE